MTPSSLSLGDRPLKAFCISRRNLYDLRKEGYYPHTGFSGSDKSREPILHPIDAEIPSGASFGEPIYLLTDEEVERQQHFVDRGEPYANRPPEWLGISGRKSIGFEIKERAEQAERVIYPIYVESDDYDPENGITLFDQFETIKEFVTEVLGADPKECEWYFSGSRSIHAHVPGFITRKSDLRRLRDASRRFNDGRAVTVDPALYTAKRPMRLPGTIHEKTGLPKVPIDHTVTSTEALREDIMSEVSEDIDRPESFRDTLADGEVSRHTTIHEVRRPISVRQATDGGSVVETSDNDVFGNSTAIECDESDLNPLLKGAGNTYKGPGSFDGRKTFFPHHKLDGNNSIVFGEVEGYPYIAPELNGDHSVVPMHVHAAINGARDYSLIDETAQVTISPADLSKWDIEPGETVVLIGNANHKLRILQIDQADVSGIMRHFEGDHADLRPEKAFIELELLGYDVGSARVTPFWERNGDLPVRSTGSSGESRAAHLQRRAETEGIDSLSHTEVLHVGNRLLARNGGDIDRATEWFRDRFGDQFNEPATREQLQSIKRRFGDL